MDLISMNMQDQQTKKKGPIIGPFFIVLLFL